MEVSTRSVRPLRWAARWSGERLGRIPGVLPGVPGKPDVPHGQAESLEIVLGDDPEVTL